MYLRESALKDWLQSIIKHSDFELQPMTGDASFRRYFRLQYNGLTQVIMDAPPPKESLASFIQVSELLQAAAIPSPQLLAEDRQQGFLLLSDLGDQLLLSALSNDTVNAYYSQAMQMLLSMQTIACSKELPPFDQSFMLKEMSLCIEWFLQGYLQLTLTSKEQAMLAKTMHNIAQEIGEQPQVFIHRDFHSRNLMVLPEGELAVIDFQDAMYGPATYDLVSLLKDCYITWPRNQVIQWVNAFQEQNAILHHYSPEALLRAFDLAGLQRHLKVLGIFSRLHLRDNKPGYLADLPRVLDYVLGCTARYEDLQDLHSLLKTRVKLP